MSSLIADPRNQKLGGEASHLYVTRPPGNPGENDSPSRRAHEEVLTESSNLLTGSMASCPKSPSSSVSLSLSLLTWLSHRPLTHTSEALTCLQLFLLTKRRAWQGLVKLVLITHKINCYFSICQAAEGKDVKPRNCMNVRSTATLACLCSRRALLFFQDIMVQFPERYQRQPLGLLSARAVSVSVHIPPPGERATPINSRCHL